MRVMVLLIGVMATAISYAQQRSVADTFNVTIVEKTPAHPHYGKGHDMGYAINGVEGKTIYMIRDSVYALYFGPMEYWEVPLYYTEPIGGGAGRYRNLDDGEERHARIYYIRARPDAPDTLYYASGEYPWMGGMILVVDSMSSSVSIEGSIPAQPTITSQMFPNPMSSMSHISFTTNRVVRCRVQIVDLHGRIVSETSSTTLPSGTVSIPIEQNDLPIGTYFYCVVEENSSGAALTTGTFQMR